MKNNIKINDELTIEKVVKRKRTIISIIEKGERKILSNIETNDYFWSKFIFDENYIVVYSRGCMVNNIPINIEAVYDIKEKKKLDLSNEKIKSLLEYMFIAKIDFELNDILAFINRDDLKISSDGAINNLKSKLTCGNNNITDEEVINYILSKYDVFADYRNLKGPLTVIEYKEIEKEIGQDVFYFHLMPQRIEYLENINLESNNNSCYYHIYITEYEHQKKVLRLKK